MSEGLIILDVIKAILKGEDVDDSERIPKSGVHNRPQDKY